MVPTKRTSRQLATVHHVVFKWSIGSTFGFPERRIGRERSLHVAAYSRDRKCLPSFLSQLRRLLVQCHRLAGHEKARIEVRLKVGYVLLAEQIEVTLVSAQAFTGPRPLSLKASDKGIEEFSTALRNHSLTRLAMMEFTENILAD